jgi:hypothetical protein
MGTRSRFAQSLRDTAFPVISRLAAFQRRFVQNLSELGISYRGSPIVQGSGQRYFDDSLRGGQGIGSRFLLLLGNEAAASEKEAAAQFCRSSNDLVELRLVPQHGMKLLRPDGYLAFVAAGAHFETDLESMQALLEHQT